MCTKGRSVTGPLLIRNLPTGGSWPTYVAADGHPCAINMLLGKLKISAIALLLPTNDR